MLFLTKKNCKVRFCLCFFSNEKKNNIFFLKKIFNNLQNVYLLNYISWGGGSTTKEA